MLSIVWPNQRINLLGDKRNSESISENDEHISVGGSPIEA